MNKILIYFTFSCIILTACGQQKSDTMLGESNCKVEKGKIEAVIKDYKSYISNDHWEEKKMELQFFNNPYKIDSSYNLVVILYGGVAYKGKFSRNISLKLPIDINNKACEMKIILERNKDIYTFNTMQVGVVDIVDDFVQIIFLPKENDWFTFYFSFSKNGKYQESP